MANSYSLFWLFVHFVSYILMGFTVYLQAKALSYDYTKVDFKRKRKIEEDLSPCGKMGVKRQGAERS